MSIVTPQRLVFIDANVPDLPDLLAGLAPGVEAFVLDPASDGLAQIAGIIAADDLTDLSSISIVGHGAAGEIEVGSTTLDAGDLSSDSAALAEIGAAIAPGGQFQLYSCDTASGAAGQRFIADLSKYAGGVDVAAATHLVGSADGGGGWTLDAATDPNAAPASAPFTQQAMADFQGELIDAIEIDQPSLGVNQLVVTQGPFPARGGPEVDPEGIPIGGLEEFAGDVIRPAGTDAANGQQLSISSNAAMFSILGPTYGGNGTSNFDIPNLGDTLAVGTGGSSQSLGANFGDDYVTLGDQNMPSQTGGGGQAFDDDQPSQQINYLINVGGSLPSAAGEGSADVIGEIIPFLGDFAPSGYMLAQGQSLPISQYSSLYDVIGNTYGGVVGSTFDLPNLDGRTIIGAGGAGGVTYTLGEQVGQDHATILPGNLPSGGDSPIGDYQPSLALNYLICTEGQYPDQHAVAPTGDAVVGQIVAYAGPSSNIPPGWALCDGQLLSIQQNQVLFAVIGAAYGGDGETTFALPNLRGSSVAGLGTDADGHSIAVGGRYGTATITLSGAGDRLHRRHRGILSGRRGGSARFPIDAHGQGRRYNRRVGDHKLEFRGRRHAQLQ